MEPSKHTPLNNTPEKATAKVPVMKENLVIDTLKTVTGRVHISKDTKTTTVEVPLPTIESRITEHRVAVNRIIDERPPVRTEGDKTIIPVVREEAVVVKRLVLVEEIHLTRETVKSERTEEVQLAEEVITVTRESV